MNINMNRDQIPLKKKYKIIVIITLLTLPAILINAFVFYIVLNPPFSYLKAGIAFLFTFVMTILVVKAIVKRSKTESMREMQMKG